MTTISEVKKKLEDSKLTKAEKSIAMEALYYYLDDATNIDGNSQGQHGKRYSLLLSAISKIDNNNEALSLITALEQSQVQREKEFEEKIKSAICEHEDENGGFEYVSPMEVIHIFHDVFGAEGLRSLPASDKTEIGDVAFNRDVSKLNGTDSRKATRKSEDVSLCRKCNCMTHDIHIPEGEIVCGKCRGVKT